MRNPNSENDKMLHLFDDFAGKSNDTVNLKLDSSQKIAGVKYDQITEIIKNMESESLIIKDFNTRILISENRKI